jgi:hypothetical protein
MARASEIRGGNNRKVQVRKAQRGFFTEDKRRIFLDHLAACCNVTAAAAAAGVGVTTVYEARRREPAFAQAWDEAIEIGYATLEALLIARAARGPDGGDGGHYVPGPTPVPGPETIDTWLAMDLLRLHRKGSGRNVGGVPARRASEKETIAAILGQLDVLRRRREREKRGRKAECNPRRGYPSPRSLRESPSPTGEGDAVRP